MLNGQQRVFSFINPTRIGIFEVKIRLLVRYMKSLISDHTYDTVV